MTFSELQSYLGYSFKNLKLLIEAFTHKSVFNGQKEKLIESNERLEFLGDAVLDLVLSDILMAEFPDNTEGDLTKKRASLVNESSLSDLALELNLDRYLQMGRFELEAGLKKNPRIMSSCFEALIGAIYLDGGYTIAKTILTSLFAYRIQKLKQGILEFKDFKTQLQEVSQKKYHVTPFYELVASEGPEHQKIFEVEVSLNGKILAKGIGRSKKIAEQNAAQKALEDHCEL